MADEHGAGNEWDAAEYDGDAGFVFEYGAPVVDLLDPTQGERILDLGCGTGHLTADIADAVGPEGRVVGVDSAPDMIREARETYPDRRFECVDARELGPGALDGPEAFDAVFSNAALHWIPEDDQAAVAERVADLLAPGGRFVAEMGGTGNVETIVDAVRAELRERGYDSEHPWYFPSIAEHATVLEDAGFEVRQMRLFDRPTELAGVDGLRNWLDVFGDSLFAPLAARSAAERATSETVSAADETEREAVVSAVEDRLRDELWDAEAGSWTADYRRLRFVAVRES